MQDADMVWAAATECRNESAATKAAGAGDTSAATAIGTKLAVGVVKTPRMEPLEQGV